MTRPGATNVGTTWCFFVAALLVTAAPAWPLTGPAAPQDVRDPAGQVHVRVVDGTSGAPLADAIVQCGQAATAITDLSGFATVPVCAAGLVVTRDGYAEARVAAPLPAQVDVRLVPQRRAAESVTVVGPAAGEAEAAPVSAPEAKGQPTTKRRAMETTGKKAVFR